MTAPHPGPASPAERELAGAFARRDAAAVRSLFQRHPEFQSRIDEPVFPFDSPALVHFAKDAALVEVLLEFGADPNRRSGWWAGGFHALHSATPLTADRLLAAGAVPDACAAAHLDRADLLAQLLESAPARVHERGGDGQTPLHFARSREVVDLLLQAGADIDARDVDHRATPAQWMLERRRGAGRYELARYLVDRGASADIFLAAAFGWTDRIRELLQADRSLLDLRTSQGEYGEKPPSSYHIYFWSIGDSRSPLDVAGQFDQPEAVAVLLEFASPLQQFLFACRSGDADRARALASTHPDLVAAMPGEAHRSLADAAWSGASGAVRLMLELGFDPRVTGHDAGTPLHLASWEGSPESVAAILEHPEASSLVAIRDAHYGATPLGWCCHGSLHGNRAQDHPRVARLLLEAGAVLDDPAPEASTAVRAVLEGFSDGSGA
jgi:ankyrin repeat protein